MVPSITIPIIGNTFRCRDKNKTNKIFPLSHEPELSANLLAKELFVIFQEIQLMS